jgi:DNA-binding SARP family transcriptional activator/streptogramin lyase
VDFRILGPLEVAGGDGMSPLPLGGAKQRAVLALLIVHRDEPISTDRLVDELWGDCPPATAAKTLQGYVSRLRKVLGNGVLQTEGHAYRLAIGCDDLDAACFERLVTEARSAASVGDLDGASRGLAEALSLWRGAALADLAYEPSVRTEAARLEELRVTAVEDHVDVDLARGRTGELLPELEALVREHPLRDRLRAQQMLALYRCGRQADALASYQHGRDALVGELGLEPGPALQELEHAILSQDPTLEPPRRTIPLRGSGHAPYNRLIAGVACLLVAVVVAAAMLKLGWREPRTTAALLQRDAVGLVDPGSGTLTGAIRVAGGPARLVAAPGRVWVGSDDARTISALDIGSRTVRAVVGTGSFPSDIASGEGALWALDREHGTVLRVNRATAMVERRIDVGAGAPFVHDRSVLDPWSLAVGAGGVWVTDGSAMLVQIDPRRGRVIRRIDAGDALHGVAVAAGAVWTIGGPSASVLRIDPRRGTVSDRIRIVSRSDYDAPYPIQIEAGEGAVWVLSANTATVSRIDPRRREVTATVPVGAEHLPRRLAVGDATVWVAGGDGALVRIDTRTEAVRTSIVAHGLNDVAVAGGRVLATGALGSGAAAGADSSR